MHSLAKPFLLSHDWHCMYVINTIYLYSCSFFFTTVKHFFYRAHINNNMVICKTWEKNQHNFLHICLSSCTVIYLCTKIIITYRDISIHYAHNGTIIIKKHLSSPLTINLFDFLVQTIRFWHFLLQYLSPWKILCPLYSN
jgi:hypothetical protein